MIRLLLLVYLGQSVSGSVIDVQIDERKSYNHIVDSLDLLCYVILLSLTILTLWAFKHKRIRFFHESGFAVLYGLVVGMILRFVGQNRPITSLRVKPVDHAKLVASGPNQTSALQAAGLPDRLIIFFNISEIPEKTVEHGKLFSYSFEDEYLASKEETDIQEKATFNPELFFYVLLPPIIFHAGYSMQRKSFFDNMGTILAFSLVGTIISALAIALVCYGFAQMISGIECSFLDMLYFGSIMSATDPCTVLSIFHDLQVDATLNGLILGESLLNDAVALVLCSSIEEYSKLSLMEEATPGGEIAVVKMNALLWTVVKFLKVFLGSVGLGCLVGSLTSILTKFTRVRDFPLLETALFFLVSYSSYLIAEIAGLSGIVSVLFCGIFQAHYTFRNLSVESQQRTKQLFEILNFLTENFIFSYLGVSLFTFTKHKFNFFFIFGTLVAIALGRALNIYPISFILNFGRSNKLPIKFQHMLWFSGLRGAMAFALSMRNTVTDVRQLFFSTTCIISVSTVIFCGGMTVPVLSLLQIPIGGTEEEREELLGPPKDGMSGIQFSNQPESLCSVFSEGGSRRSMIARGWHRFDSFFMKPLLTSSRPSLMETMPGFFAPISRLFTSADQIPLNDVPLNDVNTDDAVSLRSNGM